MINKLSHSILPSYRYCTRSFSSHSVVLKTLQLWNEEQEELFRKKPFHYDPSLFAAKATPLLDTLQLLATNKYHLALSSKWSHNVAAKKPQDRDSFLCDLEIDPDFVDVLDYLQASIETAHKTHVLSLSLLPVHRGQRLEGCCKIVEEDALLLAKQLIQLQKLLRKNPPIDQIQDCLWNVGLVIQEIETIDRSTQEGELFFQTLAIVAQQTRESIDKAFLCHLPRKV